MVLACQPGGPGSNPARIIYFCHAFINFFLCYEPLFVRWGLVRDWPKSRKSHLSSKIWTFCLTGFPSSINDDFKRGCVTDDHSFKHGCFPIQIQYLTTALGRILFSSVVMVLAYQSGGPGSNPARIIYFCHAFIHFFLCYGLCS